MKRQKLITLIGGLAIAWPLASYAQQPKQPLKRVGVLVSTVPCPLQPDYIVVHRLGELGWIEGQNIVFDCVSTVDRFDQVPALAREVVSRHPDVLIAGQSTFVMALKQETTTIPIVMVGAFDPVQLGLITSLARPGGNVTGVAWFGLFSKPMELLKEIVPHLNRVAFFEGATLPPEVIKIGNESATVAVFRPVVASDYDEIFARLAADHFDAAYIPGTPTNRRNLTRISQLALRHRIPTVSDNAELVKSGLLLNYGQDVPWTLARGAEYIDKILRGAKPSDLPVEQATKLLLTINLKTAKTLGLMVPPSLLALADEVIE